MSKISDEEKRAVYKSIRKRIVDLQDREAKTSKGEPVSYAAIGRTLDPPVSRVAVLLVVKGKSESERIKRAIERELGQPYWVRRAA